MSNEKRISFHPLAGGARLSGSLLERWESFEQGKSPIGYPLDDEVRFKDGSGYAFCQKGLLCTSSSDPSKAFYVTGRIYLHWADIMHVYGKYGCPLSDPREEDGETVQDFQGGGISTAQLKTGIDLRGEIMRRGIKMRNQAQRPTCSVQVMAFLLEYIYAGMLGKAYSHLSVEYLNHFANIADGTDHDGHCFHSMESAYNEYGVVKEALWPYNKDWVYSLASGEKFVTEAMIAEGRILIADGLKVQGRFIKPLDGKPGLSDGQFREMLQALDTGIPLGVGRDHSMTAVGYQYDDAQPGGGYIIFRNSYGEAPLFTGHQCESFEKVIATVNDIYEYRPII